MKTVDKKFREGNNDVFVFGSNLAGAHGGGAALTAKRKYGAVDGVGYGFFHNENGPHSFALPTKDYVLRTLSATEIAFWVSKFNDWTIVNAYKYDDIFVTRIGCGLAGYDDSHIAPLFKLNYYWPANVILPHGWRV